MPYAGECAARTSQISPPADARFEKGCTNSMEGQESIPSVIGPLSLSLDGLKIFFQAVLASKPWTRDPLCLRMPWQEDEYQLASHGGPKGEELCFAMLWNDGVCTPDPPYKRALEMTKTALEKAGHKGELDHLTVCTIANSLIILPRHAVIDWTPYKTAEGFEILVRLAASRRVASTRVLTRWYR